MGRWVQRCYRTIDVVLVAVEGLTLRRVRALRMRVAARSLSQDPALWEWAAEVRERPPVGLSYDDIVERLRH